MGEVEGDREGVVVREVLEEGVGKSEVEGERVAPREALGLPLGVLARKLSVKVGVRLTPLG